VDGIEAVEIGAPFGKRSGVVLRHPVAVEKLFVDAIAQRDFFECPDAEPGPLVLRRKEAFDGLVVARLHGMREVRHGREDLLALIEETIAGGVHVLHRHNAGARYEQDRHQSKKYDSLRLCQSLPPPFLKEQQTSEMPAADSDTEDRYRTTTRTTSTWSV